MSTEEGLRPSCAPDALPPALLCVGDVAPLARVSPVTLMRWAKAGRVPGAIRLGRSWRFRRELVLAWLAGGGGGQQHAD